MSDGSLFCTDERDIFAKCYIYYISSRFQPKVFDLIFIQARAGYGLRFNNYVLRKL